MQNEKTNIEHLRAIIDENIFDKTEALEFLDAIEEEISSLENQKDGLDDEIDSYKDKVIELEENQTENTIDCGIGKIEWSADNLQLELLMENLAERIKEHGALKTMRMLQIKLPA